MQPPPDWRGPAAGCNESIGAVGLEGLDDLRADGLSQQGWDGVADLQVLRRAGTENHKVVVEGLKTQPFPDRQAAMLFRVRCTS